MVKWVLNAMLAHVGSSDDMLNLALMSTHIAASDMFYRTVELNGDLIMRMNIIHFFDSIKNIRTLDELAPRETVLHFLLGSLKCMSNQLLKQRAGQESKLVAAIVEVISMLNLALQRGDIHVCVAKNVVRH